MEKKRLDIMTDIETLGRGIDCTVFQIAAMAFDVTTGEILRTFDMVADISKETPIVDGTTIKWWLDTNKELLHKLLNAGICSESELIKAFYDWIVSFGDEYEVHLWGNGILFDNNIIRSHMQKIGLVYPIGYNKDRDMRTIVELASMKSSLSEKELRKKFHIEGTTVHDAFDDVRNQISVVHNCYKIIMN